MEGRRVGMKEEKRQEMKERLGVTVAERRGEKELGNKLNKKKWMRKEEEEEAGERLKVALVCKKKDKMGINETCCGKQEEDTEERSGERCNGE